MTTVTPAQEHYLKRELIRLQLEDEVEQFNDPFALRHFGPPFTADDPKKVGGKSRSFKRKSSKKPSMSIDTSRSNNESISEQFPLTKYFFSNFVLTLPFLSREQQDYDEFWVQKVQVFFEKFMSMSMSESMDRDEASKRKKMGNKLQKLLIMMYNSGIGTTNELEYYEHTKSEIKGDEVESKTIQKLLFPTKEKLQDHLSEGVFLNGINVNVCGVRKVKTANNAILSGLNLTKAYEEHYEFLIKTRVDLPESENVYVSRRYSDFKDLHHRLKAKYPGKQLPKLPSKVKSIVNLGSSNEDQFEPIQEFEDMDEDEIQEAKLNEQHDLEIRKSLTDLFKDLNLESQQEQPKTPITQSTEKFTPQSSSKSPLKSSMGFLKSPKIWGSEKKNKSSSSSSSTTSSSTAKRANTTTSSKANEVENKLPREKSRVGLRGYLRELLKDIEVSHSEILKEFLYKGKIIKLSNEDLIDIKIRENLDLLLLVNQVKFQREAYNKINTLKKASLPLRAELLYSDNGIMKIFEEFKTKEHISELSPMLKNFIDWSKVEIAATIYQLFLGSDGSYELYTQLRRMHKLLPYSIMINILRFTNPMSIVKTMVDLLVASPFGGKSIMQTLFSGILSDDIKSQTKVIAELEAKIDQKEIIQRMKMFVFEAPSYDLVQEIRRESKDMNTDLLLTLIISPRLSDYSYVSEDLIGRVFQSYNEYKKLEKSEDNHENLEFINHEMLELYSDLKTLFKLYVRKRDKEIMKQLWAESELISILKEMFTMFYQPLVNLFASAHVDVAFKHFEDFMDDLVALLDVLTHEIYVKDTSQIVDDIMKLLEKHEDSFYQFLHDVYMNDKDGIFEKLVNWINGVLKFLRHAKDINPTVVSKRIDFNEMLKDESVNKEEVLKEVNVIIDLVKKHHEEYKKKIAKQQDKKFNVVEENWDAINKIEIFQTSDFGINDHDIISLGSDDDDDDEMTDSVLESDKNADTTHIKTLLTPFKRQVLEILRSYCD
ncbi:CYFA0S15e02234g1_1 [Cyberlindnera fabianii]|uniref:CYFA0S15e02234g1_1 n=1 Tax=Cyberlindnera fabianii TaxID=36022 RepID=A0A061BCR5_CYBFA|nr:CYFA0S15e02234g1_1 [Cyberlindnera fabianii]